MVNDDLIRAEYAASAARNQTRLAYFNFNFFGQNISTSLAGREEEEMRGGDGALLDTNAGNSGGGNDTDADADADDDADDDWTNSSAYLAKHFASAVVPGPIYDWQRSVLMDPNDPSWSKWLVSQAEQMRTRLGEDLFRGLVVDEPHPGEFNFVGDDGISWCGRPCRSLLVGWMDVARRVKDVVHGATRSGVASTSSLPKPPPTRAFLSNQINAKRIDMLTHFDGVFTEAWSGETKMRNAVGMMTMGSMPGIVWTTSAKDVTDGYLQGMLHMGVFPMAPAVGNDHSVEPGNVVADQLYSDYAPLFALLRRSRWLLIGNVVEVAKANTNSSVTMAANAFESEDDDSGHQQVVVVVSELVGGGSSVDFSLVTISVVAPIDPHRCNMHFVGKDARPVPVVPTWSSSTKRWTFPPLAPVRFLIVLRCGVQQRVTLTSEKINTIRPDFLSYTMDTAFVCNAAELHAFVSDDRWRQRVQALSPMTVRVGGTQGDFTQAAFGPLSPTIAGLPQNLGCNISKAQLEDVLSFALGSNDVGKSARNGSNSSSSSSSSSSSNISNTAVFALNALTRENARAPWNTTNARAIIELNAAWAAAGPAGGGHFGAFELGNEPALWRSNGWTNTTAAQHAADFATLRRLLYMQSGYAPAPKILGPDVFVQCLPSGCDTSYVRAFLAATPDLDAFTFHTYPWLGTVKAPATTPDAATLLNKSWLDIAGMAARAVVKEVRAAGRPQLPVWMGEGSPDWKLQGTPLGRNFSYEFAYVDMAGQLAANGVQLFARQTIQAVLGGDCGVGVHNTTLAPPAFFVAALWKRVFRDQLDVFRVHVEPGGETAVRCYALGTSLLIMNTHSAEATVQLTLAAGAGMAGMGGCTTKREEYHITGGPDMNISRTMPGIIEAGGNHRHHSTCPGIAVNGRQPTVAADGGGIVAAPVYKACDDVLIVPPRGFVFVKMR
jgi:hypothetical protein